MGRDEPYNIDRELPVGGGAFATFLNSSADLAIAH